MSWGAVIGLGAAVIGGVGSSKASKAQEKAAQRAGDAQLQAARETVAEQRRQYDQTRADQAPWMQAGENALSVQQEMLFGVPDNKYGEFTGNTYEQGANGTWNTQGNESYSYMGSGTQAGAEGGGQPSWFNEQSYLDANPDAREHYNMMGDNGQRVWSNAQYGELGREYTPYDHYQDAMKAEGTPRNLGQGQTDPTIATPLSEEEEAYMQEFVDPAMHDQFRQTPPGERAKYVQAGGQTAGTPNPNIPSKDYQGTQLSDPDYAAYQGPDARDPLAAGPDIPANANLPDTVAAPDLGEGPTQPDVYAQFNAAELGVQGPEFATADTSYGAFQDSANYEAMLFAMQEGMKGEKARQSALGVSGGYGNISGRQQKELQRYGAGVAGQYYGDFFNQATSATRDANINAQADYANQMGISREDYGRTQDVYQSSRDVYGDQRDSDKYAYETGQDRMIKQHELDRRAWSDLSAQEMAEYGMDQTRYEQTVAERNQQFDAAGIIRSEATADAKYQYNTGRNEWMDDQAVNDANYNRGAGEYGDYYNRAAGVSSTGQTTATNLGYAGANMAANVGNATQTGAANYGNAMLSKAGAQAQGYAGMANAAQQGISGFTDYLANRSPSGGSNSVNYGQNEGEYYGGNDLYYG